ncbi:hypothetical protein ACFQX8_18285 [Klenkia terrae]|uniref:hypothetical protein n=1 Tax=Klenkia terrae TaxID=1052259 RepID=UPI00360F2809
MVNSSQGGGSKDTWVISGPRPVEEPVPDRTQIEFTTADLPAEPPRRTRARPTTTRSPRASSNSSSSSRR